MAKNSLRSVNTRFWNDTFIEDLDSSEKLLFLYLLTNPLTNILGVYEVSVKRMSYDTGLKKETILNALKGFEMVKKAFFVENYIILPNFLKNQNLNANMKKGAVDIFNNLPKTLKFSILGVHKDKLIKDSEGFQMVSNGLVKYRSIESEVIEDIEVIEKEKESDFKKITEPAKLDFNLFWDLYDKKTGKDKCLSKWNKLNIATQTKILEYIPKYKVAQPDKKFRKNPETFFNNKSWEDELIQENAIINTQMQTKTRINYDSDKF